MTTTEPPRRPTFDPALVAIERPAPERLDAMRDAVRAIDAALDGGWPVANGVTRAPDGSRSVVVIAPWSKYIGSPGGYSTVEDGTGPLETMRTLVLRALAGDLDHPERDRFPLDARPLAYAIGLAVASGDRADPQAMADAFASTMPPTAARVAARSAVVVELPHPLAPLRAVRRRPGGSMGVDLLDEEERVLLSALAPPTVGLLATETAVTNGHLKVGPSIGLSVAQERFPLRTLRTDPVATLRALALLETHGFRP